MIVKVLASGSGGNSVYVSNGEVSVLVDAGLPKTKLEKAMLENDITPSILEAIFLTHEHGDHVAGIAFADKFKIPVYASEGTLKELGRLRSGRIIRMDGFVTFNALQHSFLSVSAFPVSHDAMEPYGYVIHDQECKVSVLMDTGTVTNGMLKAMFDSDVYVFECNHDLDMLESGDYHDGLKLRVKSDIGHLSNDAAAAALACLVRGKGERIYLTHMSSNNNLPALAEGTVKAALRKNGLQAGKHFFLEVV